MNVKILNTNTVMKIQMKDIIVEKIESVLDESQGLVQYSDGSTVIPRRLFIFLSYRVRMNEASILASDSEDDSHSIDFPISAIQDNSIHNEDSLCTVARWEVECTFSLLSELNKIIDSSTYQKSTQSSIVKIATNLIPNIQNQASVSTSIPHHPNKELQPFISSEFPKNFEKIKQQSLFGSLGMGSMSMNMSSIMGSAAPSNRQSFDNSSQDEEKKKRKQLIVWLQDVMHNFDLLPVEAKTLLIELIHTTKLTAKAEPINLTITDSKEHSQKVRKNNGVTDSKDPSQLHKRLNGNSHLENANHISPSSSRQSSKAAQALPSAATSEKAAPFSPTRITNTSQDQHTPSREGILPDTANESKSDAEKRTSLKVRPKAPAVPAISVSVSKHGELEAPKVMCISRNERILCSSQLKEKLVLFDEHVARLAVIAVIVILLSFPQSTEWIQATSPSLKATIILGAYLAYILYLEDRARIGREDNQRKELYGYVESLLCAFLQRSGQKEEGWELDLQALIFNTEEQQPYVPAPPVVHNAKSGINGINPLLRKPSQFLSSAVSAVSFSFNRQKSLPAADVASPQIAATTITEEDEKDPEEEAQQADKAFEDFQFADLSPAARDIYIDRRFTHSFQVRGPHYKTDGKKVHPGSAVCKCMLMELYEVEPKVTNLLFRLFQ